MQWVRPMENAANSLTALFVFLPVDPASAKDFKKSIFYFPSHRLA
jgi:hypothetical protein